MTMLQFVFLKRNLFKLLMYSHITILCRRYIKNNGYCDRKCNWESVFKSRTKLQFMQIPLLTL